jgi:hypothetical protein
MSTPLSLSQTSSIQQLITDGYSNLQSQLTNTQKYNIYYTIIEQKVLLDDNHHIYIDIKSFIHHYILSTYEQDFGYDVISVEIILDTISLLAPKKQEPLYKYTIHQLKQNGQETIVPSIEMALHNNQIAIEKNDISSIFHVKSAFKLLLLLSTKSYSAIFISLFLMICALCIVLWPTPYLSMQLFIYQYTKFSGVFILDHLINVILLLLGTDDRTKVYAVNPVGAFVIIASKLFYLIFIAKIILKQLDKKMDF